MANHTQSFRFVLQWLSVALVFGFLPAFVGILSSQSFDFEHGDRPIGGGDGVFGEPAPGGGSSGPGSGTVREAGGRAKHRRNASTRIP